MIGWIDARVNNYRIIARGRLDLRFEKKRSKI